MKKRGLLTSKIPVLRIHTIKTSLIVWISISKFFSGSKKLYYYRISKKIQLGFSSKKKVPHLGSAQNFHSSARLELENSGLGSSLVLMVQVCQGQPRVYVVYALCMVKRAIGYNRISVSPSCSLMCNDCRMTTSSQITH